MAWTDNPVVPFGTMSGNMFKNEYDGRRGDILRMVPVEPVVMTLKFKHFVHHNTTMSVLMEDSDGHTFPMFIGDFEKIISQFPLDAGATPMLRWDYSKKGSNYGIKVADNQEGI